MYIVASPRGANLQPDGSGASHKIDIFEGLGIDTSTEHDLFISLGDVIRQTQCLFTPKSDWLATALPMHVNLKHLFNLTYRPILFYNASECIALRVSYLTTISLYIVNVQRIQLMLIDVPNCAVIKMLLWVLKLRLCVFNLRSLEKLRSAAALYRLLAGLYK
jgi:hypothetical protein